MASQCEHLRHRSLLGFCEEALRLEGGALQTTLSPDETVTAAFSTHSVPQALGNAMNKSLEDDHVSAPSVLLVPPSFEWRARNPINSSEPNLTGADVPTGNPARQLAKGVVEPRIENTAFTGSATTQWYLFSDRRNGCFTAAILRGK